LPLVRVISVGTEVEMAQKVIVALEDDLDGSVADETVRFGLDGADLEIDLSAKNARSFRAQVAPFIARPQGQPRIGSPGCTDCGRSAAQRRCPCLGTRAWHRGQ